MAWVPQHSPCCPRTGSWQRRSPQAAAQSDPSCPRTCFLLVWMVGVGGQGEDLGGGWGCTRALLRCAFPGAAWPDGPGGGGHGAPRSPPLAARGPPPSAWPVAVASPRRVTSRQGSRSRSAPNHRELLSGLAPGSRKRFCCDCVRIPFDLEATVLPPGHRCPQGWPCRGHVTGQRGLKPRVAPPGSRGLATTQDKVDPHFGHSCLLSDHIWPQGSLFPALLCRLRGCSAWGGHREQPRRKQRVRGLLTRLLETAACVVGAVMRCLSPTPRTESP